MVGHLCSYFSFFGIILTLFPPLMADGWWCYRSMVACGFPFNDGDRGTHHTDAAVCFQRIRVGIGILMLDVDGCSHFLLILFNVQSAWTLWEIRSPPYPFPGTRRWRLRSEYVLLSVKKQYFLKEKSYIYIYISILRTTSGFLFLHSTYNK